MAIQSVTLRNFRGFDFHTVAFNDQTILVGLNNAGKSTLIDGLRLLAVAAARSTTARFVSEPAWLRHAARGRGYSVSFDTVDFDFDNIGYNQDRETLSKLEIRFRNRSVMTLWLDPESQANFVQIKNSKKEIAEDRAAAAAASLTPIYIMPPIQRLLTGETLRNPETIKRSSYGRLAHRHFRNQLFLNPTSFRAWKSALEASWPNLRVMGLDTRRGEGENEIHLMVGDPPFVSEVAWVGSGLQSWMQIIWFLARTPKDSSVVLDEPDAFLHADLQRKLVKMGISSTFRQVTIATHSAEIISDVDPQKIVVVRKKNRYSKKPGNTIEIQRVIEDLGSRHNVQLSKLSEAKRVLVYEGDDQKYLSQVALSLGGNFFHSFMDVPYFDIGGVENWKEAVGAGKALDAATANHVGAYLIIDRDYKVTAEVEEISKKAREVGLDFHCWQMKEIENYFVNRVILAKYVSSRGNRKMSVDEAEKLISECAESLIDDTIKKIQQTHYPNGVRADAEARLKELENSRSIEEIVSGKRLISCLSAKVKKDWGCQLSPMNLCRFAEPDDLPAELVALVRKVASLTR